MLVLLRKETYLCAVTEKNYLSKKRLMNFFIRKNSLLPNLVVEITESVSPNETQKFYERLQNATITFSMHEVGSCLPQIQYGVCDVCEVKKCEGCESAFVIVYKWQHGDTDKIGVFDATFEVTFNDNGENLILPIKNKLLIKIT